MDDLEKDLIGAEEAAQILGVIKGRVVAMINQKCPDCNGEGAVEGVPCPRCHHSGRYLPAKQLGSAKNAPWLIDRKDLQLVAERKVGRRKTKRAEE